MSIDDVRARLATIEAKFQPQQPEQQAAAIDTENGAFAQLLLKQTLGSTGPTTLGQMWQSATGQAISPRAGTSPNQGAGLPARAAQFQPYFEAAGARYGVDPDLLAAVAWAESGFNPDAVSHAGALGLMQIMPGTASGLGVDPRDPIQAIDGAARYLRTQLDRFGDPRLALAAYNAGPGAVEKYGGIPPYPETTAYVTKVAGHYEQIRSTR